MSDRQPHARRRPRAESPSPGPRRRTRRARTKVRGKKRAQRAKKRAQERAARQRSALPTKGAKRQKRASSGQPKKKKRRSKAEPVLPGQLVFAEARIQDGRHWLRPDAVVVLLVKFLLAVYATKYGMKLHGLVLMSTHYHLLFTDVRGQRSAFFRDFHAMLGKLLQVVRGSSKRAWTKDGLSKVEVVSREGAIESYGYMLANPVAAHLVAEPRQWPGLLSAVAHVARRVRETLALPDRIRCDDGRLVRWFDPARWPCEAELVFEPLAERLGMDPDDCVQAVQAHLDALVADAHQELAKTKGRWLGVHRALRVPVHREAGPPPGREELNPRVKAGRGQRDLRELALARRRDHQAGMARALEAVRAGETGVVFPAGTDRWHHVFGFPRQDPPPLLL